MAEALKAECFDDIFDWLEGVQEGVHAPLFLDNFRGSGSSHFLSQSCYSIFCGHLTWQEHAGDAVTGMLEDLVRLILCIDQANGQ